MNDQHAHTKRTYSISDYDPNWITKFESIKDFISQVFAHKALQIEHVGSTSIQGMKAKPLIDVLVIVEDINDMFQETRTMIDAGYEWSENHIAPNTLLFYKTDTHGEKSENIHVCEAHSSKAHQLILMRDFLRTFPEKAKEYAHLKGLLVKKHPDNYLAYRESKASFLNQIEKEAYAWKHTRNTI